VLRADEIIIPVSALTGKGCSELLEVVSRLLTADARLHQFILPASAGRQIAWLHANGEVTGEEDADEGDEGPQRLLKVLLTPRDLGRFSRL
jgi:GTP-binding protein HflX